MWKCVILMVFTNIFNASCQKTSNFSVAKEISVVYGLEGTITCNITSSIPMHIQWYYVNDTKGEKKEILPSNKYSISTDGTQLKIKSMDLDLVGTYICTATYSTRVQIVLIAPKITGETNAKATRGTTAVLVCRIIKGVPKPKISWQFMNDSGSEFVPIAGSNNELRIQLVKDEHAGRYKCVAENSAGSDELVTKFIVESSPKIISKPTTVFGIEGDVAIRIPCIATGIPRPRITWGVPAHPNVNEKYYVDSDGALVILKPNLTPNRALYECKAKNYIGIDTMTSNAIIEPFPKDFGIIHHVYLLMGETKKLECGTYRSKSQEVRWFMEGVELNKNTSYFEVKKATDTEDGNYTCRASDKHGYAETHTYVVDVGYPPNFEYENNPINDWRGDINDILSNCLHIAKPLANVEWKFNGKVVTVKNILELGNEFKWGHYSCNVSNVHGSIQRSFDVKSSVCAIKRNFGDVQNMPLLLTVDLTWPKWKTTKYHFMIESGEQFTLSCPNRKEAPNSFQNFPKQSELKVQCDKQDTFLVEGKLYKLTDLLCSNGISPSIVRSKVKCSTETSELIHIGYNVPGFLETYKVCFDHAYNMPLYSRVLMKKTDGSQSPAHPTHWYKYPEVGDSKGDKALTCKDSSSSCCYGKSQLVDARDFNSDHAKNSTFIDPLNAIPYWRPCDNEDTTWEDIDGMVRIQLANYNKFDAWSGIHTLEKKYGAVIPRYLWKVLKFDEDESVAIVHVNDPSPTDKDIKCNNICTEEKEPWFEARGIYTYCCRLSEFIEAFDMTGGINFKEQ